MSYSVTFYIGTGLNAINTADTLAHVASFAASAVSVPNCDIVSCRNLNKFRVAVSPKTIEKADFVYVSGENDAAMFSIDGIVPTSPDVCEVYVTIDYWLTAGGITNITFLDGITERHHVPLAADVFGAYDEKDPWMAPSKPLQIDDGGIKFAGRGNGTTFIEASLNIYAMGGNSSANALTYTDANTGETVCVPRTISLEKPSPDVGVYKTQISMNLPSGAEPGTQIGTDTPVTCYFEGNDGQVLTGLSKVRDLGCEGTILNCWLVPNDFIQSVSDYGSSGIISDIKSAAGNVSSGLNYLYANANNMRVFYGEHNRYIIQSVASGNIAEFNPEDIYNSDTAPDVICVADIRPHGKPYFRFQYYKGSGDFWRNCIAGLEWQNAPLIYTDKSGRTIDKTIFYSERGNAAEIRGYDIASKGLGMALNAGSSVVGMSGGPVERPLEESVGFKGVGAGIYGAASSLVGGIAGMFTDEQKYNIARENEMRQFAISQYVVTPEIQYPREEGLRDFLGNGCRVYRLRYSASDVTKIDKILTAYGYKDTALLEASHFNNRSKFNYVKASGVSVKDDNIPKWIRDGIAAQLSAGMRIWHVKPDPAIYTNGTNT